MCILSFLPGGIGPDVDGLFNGGLQNGDGHGWAIVADDASHIVMGKSLDLLTALDGFEQARAENMRGPALFHSRWATHGSVSTANVHPFDVGGSALTVVAHNGILSRVIPKKGDDRSDTRLFADDVLSTRYRRFDKARAFDALTDFIGSGNKLVILTADPRYRHNAYIVNEKAGNWDKETGIWHSNYDYLGTPRWMQNKYSGYTWQGKNTAPVHVIGQRAITATNKAAAAWYDECAICHYGNVDENGYCEQCGTCSDCLEARLDCLCYVRHDFSAAIHEDDVADEYDTRAADLQRIFGYTD